MKINILTPVRKGGPYFIGKQLVEELNKRGFQAKHIHGLKDLLLSPFKQDCDIIHSMGIPIFFSFWKKPFILTVHGEYPIEKNIWRHFYPLAIKKADVVTVPSKFLKKRLGLNKAVVIPNAVDTRKFKQVKHSDKKEINIVTVTKFYFEDKAKGVLKLSKIVDNAAEKTGKKIKYTVVGGGKYLREVKEKTKNSKVKINFTGFVDNPSKYLEKSDIFLYYSTHESFGIVLLEAMASGLPVIVNRYGPFSEIIDDGKDGFITETNEGYRRRLIKLINSNEVRKDVGLKARKKVREKYDWSKVINKYVKLYKR